MVSLRPEPRPLGSGRLCGASSKNARSLTVAVLCPAPESSRGRFKSEVGSLARSVIFHRGTASFNTRSRTALWSPHSSTTSTGRPSSSSRSARKPPGKNGVLLGPASISKSRSLSFRASPRAKEPNTRMLVTPCLAAMARIASRFVARSSSSVITSLKTIVAGPHWHAPCARKQEKARLALPPGALINHQLRAVSSVPGASPASAFPAVPSARLCG